MLVVLDKLWVERFSSPISWSIFRSLVKSFVEFSVDSAEACFGEDTSDSLERLVDGSSVLVNPQLGDISQYPCIPEPLKFSSGLQIEFPSDSAAPSRGEPSEALRRFCTDCSVNVNSWTLKGGLLANLKDCST